MNDNTNREVHFQRTTAVIHARRNSLELLSVHQLDEICRIQEVLDTRAEKEKLIDSIMKNDTNNHHPITEERYQFVLCLYRIRKQYRRMGLFQPDFICIIFGKMMVSKLQRSDADIKIAVNDWCKDSAKSTAKYGHISKWNTSLVTDMKQLFQFKSDFNDDISKWNVRNVTDMYAMFRSTVSFNRDISGWNVSSVTNMEYMFSSTPFNGDISRWNVSSVTNMEYMFSRTPFNGDISGWNVSNVTSMSKMFFGASLFKRDISGWDVRQGADMSHAFCNGCPIPTSHKPPGHDEPC